ncbi:MAG: 2-keto-4-pentenoate hydratase [Candidatus Acidiferrales bacterium]
MNQPWDDPRISRGMKAQFLRRRQLLHAGHKPLGWKVAFGSPAAMERFNLQAPLVGFLTDRAQLGSGSTLSLSGWTKPLAEPEIAVLLGKDLAGGSGREEVRSAIAAISPAFELVDVTAAPSAENLEAVLAGNIFQRQVVLGPSDASRAGGVLDGLTCRVLKNGAEIARTSDPQAATGKLIENMTQVAGLIAAFGESLRAGEIVITGSVIPPLEFQPGDRLDFYLDPAGNVSISAAQA